MDHEQFDRVTRTLATGATRRSALKVFAAGGIGTALHLLRLRAADAEHYGCIHYREPCSRNGQCCSGICTNGRCRAHNKGICTTEQNFCTQGGDTTVCGSASGGGNCLCTRTTGKTPFCAENFTGVCGQCTRDKECQETYGPGAACITGGPACPCTDRTKGSCAIPCAGPT